MKIHTSLKNILYFNFVLVAVLPVLIIGLIALKFLTDSLASEITTKNFSLTKALAGEVERFLNAPMALLQQVVEIAEKKDGLKEDQINTYLDTIRHHYDYFDMIQIVNKKGEVRHMAPFDPDLIGINLSNQPFYQSALQSREPCWSPTFISMQTAQPTLTLSQPTENGMVIGYLNLNILNAITAKAKIGTRGYALITDQMGTAISHPNRRYVSERRNFKNFDIIHQGLSGKEGSFETRFGKTENLASMVIVPQTGWLVVFLQQVDEAFAPVRKLTPIFGVGIVFTVLLAVGMALASIAKTLNPLSHLMANAQKVADGDYQFESPPKSYREIDALAKNIKVMAEAVKSREKALIESEERFRSTFEQAAVGIAHTSPEGKFLRVNQRLCDIFGYPHDEMMQLTFHKLTHPEDLEPDLQQMDRLLTGEIGSYHLEKRYIRKDGSVLWGYGTAALACEPAGDVKYFICVVEDISDRKQMEAKILELNAELEKRVRERTAELETANRDLQEFAYIVSHDLKAPLRAIAQLAHWIAEDYGDAFDPDGREHMRMLLNRVKRMDGFIDGILQYSRLGRAGERAEHVDLNDLVQEVIDTLMPLENTQVIIEGELPIVLGDRIRLQQVFQNLMSNAIKYNDKPLKILRVGCSAENVGWKFSVADNGPGIEEKYHRKIFQIFQTLAPRDEHESTGIGLTLVKRIIERYEGKIWLESEIGHGTTFYFTLPKKSFRKQEV